MGRWDRYQNLNRLKRVNRLVQAALFILLVGSINYLALRLYWRADWSQDRLFSLSPETRAYVRELQEPVRFVVTIPRNPLGEDEEILARYVDNLLQAYAYAARENSLGRIEIEWVDIYKQQERARELANDYGLEQPNTVLLLAGAQQRFLLPADLMEFENLRPVAFKGEQAVTSALLEVATGNQPTLLFSLGHGEMSIDDSDPVRGLSLLASELRARNFLVRSGDLNALGRVPEDTDLLVIADPQGPFLPEELEYVRRFLSDEAGRLLLLVSPGRRSGLDDLLLEWGLQADDMLVLERGSDYLEGTGDILVRQFAPHPITDSLIENQTPVLAGLLRPLRPDPGAPLDERLQTTVILGSSTESYAERAYRSQQDTRFDPRVDLPGPVPVGAVAERRTVTALGIDLGGGKLVAYGSGELFANRRLGALGNRTLMLNTMNWLVERDAFLSIPPRPLERFQLTVSRRDLLHVALSFAAVPGLVGLLGLAVMWSRRR